MAVKSHSGRPNQLFRNLNSKIASIPLILTSMVIFLGGTIWTVVYSFTNSKLLPRTTFVGFDQYERLWAAPRWIISIQNLAIYGILSLIFSLVIGFLLAALMDQKIRFENTFRTIFLYPFALSFIVTGLVWQWLLNPEFGIQSVVRSLGWESFTFDPLYNSQIVIYGILIAALWQGTGLVMCLMLAGLRGIDEDIWKAARVDGIPMWKTYLLIVIPMMRPSSSQRLSLSPAASSRSTTSSWRRRAAVRASPRKCRRNMSMTTCSRPRTWGRALPPPP